MSCGCPFLVFHQNTALDNVPAIIGLDNQAVRQKAGGSRFNFRPVQLAPYKVGGILIGTWHHAQLFHSYDDRPETVQKYGQPLVCWQNSWSRWNSGPRRVRGTTIDIPHGSFWALAETIDKVAGVEGDTPAPMLMMNHE